MAIISSLEGNLWWVNTDTTNPKATIKIKPRIIGNKSERRQEGVINTAHLLQKKAEKKGKGEEKTGSITTVW